MLVPTEGCESGVMIGLSGMRLICKALHLLSFLSFSVPDFLPSGLTVVGGGDKLSENSKEEKNKKGTVGWPPWPAQFVQEE